MTLRAATTLPAVAMLTLCGLVASTAREHYPGQYAQADQDKSQWFREQVSPKSGIACCSQSDGEFAEEDIRYGDDGVGHYWTRWSQHAEWMQVPDDVVIKKPNKWGRPTVWWTFDSQANLTTIRCYTIGTGS